MPRTLILLALSGLLGACSNMISDSTAPAANRTAMNGIAVSNRLPEQLPTMARQLGASPFVVIQTREGDPVFGSLRADMSVGAHTEQLAGRLGRHLESLPVKALVRAQFEAQGLKLDDNAALEIRPYVLVQQCVDNRYRLTLSYAAIDHSAAWSGRYSYHLPTAVLASRLEKLDPKMEAQLKKELETGAARLAELIRRDFSQQLKGGRLAEIGSLYLVGDHYASMAGGEEPEDVTFTAARIVEDREGHVIARLSGDLKSAPYLGGLNYGVHYFEKTELHTLRYSR